jgi:hypothetical protein
VLDGALPPGFVRRVVVIQPGNRRPYRRRDWKDAIVSVDSGEIWLECDGQSARSFRRGDLLTLRGLGLRAIYNPGPDVAVLIAVSKSHGKQRRPA